MYVIICFEDIKFLGVDLGLIKILCGFFKDLFWFVWDFYYDLIIIEERGGFFFFLERVCDDILVIDGWGFFI